MKFNVLAFTVLAAIGAMAAPSDNYEDGLDISYADGQTRETEILSYLLTVQANERAAASYLPRGCHYEGTAPFCAANGCPRGYRERGRSACGDGACCVTGWKVLCCI